MPRINARVYEDLFEGSLSAADKATICALMIAHVTRVGEDFKEKLEIRGPEDIWVEANVMGGQTSKKTIFAEAYMIPKPCRTDEVIAEFLDAVDRALVEALKASPVPIVCIPGIDMPPIVTPRPLYHEREPKEFG